MFIKVYRYTIFAKNLAVWKKNNKGANRVYEEYGAKRLESMMRRGGDKIEMMEIGYYGSRAEFDKIASKVDEDKRIKKLFGEFKKIVRGKITVEDYETASRPPRGQFLY
jgi:hypothetical protein